MSNRVTLITPEDEPFSLSTVDNLRRQRKLNRRKMYCNICLTLFSYMCFALIFFDLGILVSIDALTYNGTYINNGTIIIFDNYIPIKHLIIFEGMSSIIFMGIFILQMVMYF